jgi:hypothetical protein
VEGKRRNHGLLQLHVMEPRRRTWRDWVFLAMCAMGLALAFAVPIVLIAWFVHWLIHR